MTTTRDSIRDMVQSLIKDDRTNAELAFHPVLTQKMKEVSGIQQKVTEPSALDDANSDDE